MGGLTFPGLSTLVGLPNEKTYFEWCLTKNVVSRKVISCALAVEVNERSIVNLKVNNLSLAVFESIDDKYLTTISTSQIKLYFG